MWDHIDGCAKHNCCASTIYLLSCLDLECFIIVYKEVGAPGHARYYVDVLNARDKWMTKLEMANPLNAELF